MCLHLENLLLVLGGGVLHLPRILLIILPVPHFSSQTVPCSCCVYLCHYHTVLSLILYLLSGLMQSREWYLFSSKLFLSSDKTPSVSLVYFCWFWVQCVHEFLGPCCWLCLAHRKTPNKTIITLWSDYWSLDFILSLFTLKSTSEIPLYNPAVHSTTLQ